MRDKREKNWFWLENEIVDRVDLEPMERLLYMVLARHSDEDTSESFPSEETLCNKTGIKDKRTIRKYINNLEAKELISVNRVKGKSNRYYLNNVKAVTKNDTSSKEKKDKVVTKNDTTINDTSDICCKEVVTFDAQTSIIECHSNKTHNKTHIKIMNHEEHDFFENLFKELKIKFTVTNQKSVAKLLKTMSINDTKSYLEETYKNLKNNPDIKNLSGAFTSKISTGKRQDIFKTKKTNLIENPKESIIPVPLKKKPVLSETIEEEKIITNINLTPELEQKAINLLIEHHNLNLNTIENMKRKSEKTYEATLKQALREVI